MPLTRKELSNAKIHLAYMKAPNKQRGYKLFKEGHVKYLNFDKESNTYNFQVKGNLEPFYKVSLNLSDSPESSLFDDGEGDPFTCNCLHFKEEVQCKHVAASFQFILDNSKKDLNQIITVSGPKPVEVSFPVLIKCTEDGLKNLHELIPVDPKIYNPDTHLSEVVFMENGLRYILTGYYLNGTIEVTFNDGQVTIYGSNKKPHIVKQALKWLKDRFSKEMTNDAFIITQKQRDAIVFKKLEEKGVLNQLKKPLEALEFSLFNNVVILRFGGELEGMVNIDSMAAEVNKNLSPIIPSSVSITEVSHENEIGAFNAGFALAYFYDEPFSRILPIMAKGSKKDPAALNNKFVLIEDPYDMRLAKTENLDKALYQISKIAKSGKKNSSLDVFELFREFLDYAKDYPIYVFLGDGYDVNHIRKSHFDKALQIHEASAKIVLTKTGIIFQLEVHITFGEFELKLSEVEPQLDITKAFGVFQDTHLLLFENRKVLDLMDFLLSYPILKFVERDFETFFQKIIQPMAGYIEIQDETGTLKQAEVVGPLQRQLYVSELSGLVIFRPQVKYSDTAFSNPLESNSILDGATKTIYLRDGEFESLYLDFLRELHPNFKNSGNQGFFHLTHDTFMQGLWFFKAFEKLKTEQIRVFGLENIKIKRYNPFPPAVSMEFGSSQDWFEVNASVAFGDQKVKLKDIKKALDLNQDYVELEDGSFGILPEIWLKKFGKLFRSGESDKNGFKVPKTLFQVLDGFEETMNFPEILQEIEDKKEKLKAFTQIKKADIPKKLKAELRNYQHTGLNWLNFLQEYHWGGILADDMGLGKTLQMIALICKIAESNKAAKILVVAPTTLLFNWKNELEKFAPHLDYFIHHGNRSDSVDELNKHQVLLTSYGLVINDLELLQKIKFEAIIADESQAIKNTQSLRYKSITKLNGKIKMAMTGTPIENSLAELFAQMNFVNPGFFHSFNSFRENYLKPLKNGDREILLELQNKIRPFVLRRTKEEVLTELPDKTEEYLYCVMNPLQRKIYDAYRNEYRDYLLKKFDEDGAENSKMYVLEGLTKLRLACDATNLVSHTETKNESVKIDLLIEHILEKTGDHKILIFSQFVKMLGLVQSKLEENLIDYTYLDGSTTLKNREKEVQQFQTNEQKRVFLISMKAGGTGLNLTAADYVYVLDPWWNPAVENQAIDRCYRMGQEKHVIAYRMICKDTVEEKIMLLQQAKSKLAKEVISEGDSFLGALDKESMLSLFE
ncbi:SNF2 family helicase [Aquiflexum sp. LQ15W]|uniref:DEAD/DEAH box helicase n=1 Tax=Cognataquiflexum nitidum TaxID=2922272 RepID=UPI001F14959D|nr:DEAD/DEAH box helicase [Cognataquiflexum nitidum]MCH6199123.1 SNF2 family helicase [Cognataquiflexum nitidum]